MSCNRRKQCIRNDFGFTLVEVVVSITLFAVALSLLVGVFGFTSKAWDSGERIGSESSDLVRIHRLLGNMLDRLYPITFESDEDEVYAFTGSSRQLRFTALLPPYPAEGGLHLVEFSITQSEDLYRLSVKLAPYSSELFSDNDFETDEKSLLLETTDKLDFSYYGSSVAEEWQSEWPKSEPPPQLVKLQKAESVDSLAEMVVPITVNMDLACAIPDLEGACRL